MCGMPNLTPIEFIHKQRILRSMKVSVVIPTYNSEEYIGPAIESVVNQTYQDIECVIKDGGSKDRTAEIVKEYQAKYGTKVVFISEKDKGVFDAINEGVKRSSGEIIGWMGSDDFYADPNVVEKAVHALVKADAEMCWGDLMYVDRDAPERVIRYWKSSPYKKGMYQKGWQLPHFASFVRKSVFERVGYFDTSFRIAADYDFFLRVLEIGGTKSVYVPEVFLKMRAGGQSNRSVKNIIEGNKDCYRAWAKNGYKMNPFLLFFRKPFVKLKQYLVAPKSNTNTVEHYNFYSKDEPVQERTGQKKALVAGAGGFIGSHLVKRLKKEGYWVRGVDLKYPEFAPTAADDFVVGDLRDFSVCRRVLDQSFDEVYQLAADMGGAGYLFTGENDADIMHNSAIINLHIADLARHHKVPKLFYSSSACVYPEYNQLDPENPKCSEDSVYPAQPESDYGFEKLFSERVYAAYKKNYGIDVKIARFHNIFGPEGTWMGGKEKAPAALCRKIASTPDGGEIEIWGDGKQTRSFLYIDECIEGVRRLMESDFAGPVNIGSEEMVTINQLAETIMELAGKKVNIKHIPGPLGVRGRNSDNKLIHEKLGWKPSDSLKNGLSKSYAWIKEQVAKQQKS